MDNKPVEPPQPPAPSNPDEPGSFGTLKPKIVPSPTPPFMQSKTPPAEATPPSPFEPAPLHVGPDYGAPEHQYIGVGPWNPTEHTQTETSAPEITNYPGGSHADEHPLDIGQPPDEPAGHPQEEAPASEATTNLTDINPNWRTQVSPEVHDAAQNAQAAGWTPSLEDTQPISLAAIRKVAAEQGINIPAQPTAEPTPPPVAPEPVIQPQPQAPAVRPSFYNPGNENDLGIYVPPVPQAQPQTAPQPATPQATQPEQPAPAPKPRTFWDKIFGKNK